MGGTATVDARGLTLNVSSSRPIQIPLDRIESVSGTPTGEGKCSVVVIPSQGDWFAGITAKLDQGRQLVDEIRRQKSLDRGNLGWWGQLPEDFGVSMTGQLLHDPTGSHAGGAGFRAGAWPAGLTVTTSTARTLIRWASVGAIKVEGLDQIRTRPSPGAVLVFGVLGLAAARKESESYVTVTTRDGDWVLEVRGTLPSPLRGRLGPVLRNPRAPRSGRGPAAAPPRRCTSAPGRRGRKGLGGCAYWPPTAETWTDTRVSPWPGFTNQR